MSSTHEQRQPQAPEWHENPRPGRRRVLYPYGSASGERDDAITVLGALKVATATQFMRLLRPHLTDNKSVRNALLDLGRHGLVSRTATPPGTFRAGRGRRRRSCGG